MKCSVIVALVLAGTPFLWITLYFMCVVVIVRRLPVDLARGEALPQVLGIW